MSDCRARAHPPPHQEMPFNWVNTPSACVTGTVPVHASCSGIIINRASFPTESILVKVIHDMVTLILNKVESW